MLVMNRTFENVTRYNISENDRTHLVQIHCDLADRNTFHNNVFYVDYGTADLDFFRGNAKERDINTLGATFYNNIFYATGQARFRTVYSAGEVIGREFDEVSKPNLPPGTLFLNNCYYGPWKNGLPDDPQKIVADPMFIAPGTGGNGICTLDGYKLQLGSPCINAGLFIPLNSKRDYFGNPVGDGSVDIGVYEQLGSGAFADIQKEEALNEEERIKSRLAWTKWMFPKTLPIPEDGKLVIILREPIEPTITGSLIWSDRNGKWKPVTLQLDKSQQRNNFTFTLKADQNTLSESSVRVSLKEGTFSEEWNIPLVVPTQNR